MNEKLTKLCGTPRSLQPKLTSSGISTGQMVLIIVVVAVGTAIIVIEMNRHSNKLIAEMNKRDREKMKRINA